MIANFAYGTVCSVDDLSGIENHDGDKAYDHCERKFAETTASDWYSLGLYVIIYAEHILSVDVLTSSTQVQTAFALVISHPFAPSEKSCEVVRHSLDYNIFSGK